MSGSLSQRLAGGRFDQANEPHDGARPPNATAEPARPKIKRSRTPGDEPAEIANDSATGSASESGGPSEDDIRDRAYHRYLQRGGGHGMDFDDWLEAERELKKG